MSDFIAATGNNYVCHAAALRRWLNREKKENPKWVCLIKNDAQNPKISGSHRKMKPM
jgi:hypothetical protein